MAASFAMRLCFARASDVDCERDWRPGFGHGRQGCLEFFGSGFQGERGDMRIMWRAAGPARQTGAEEGFGADKKLGVS